MMGSVRHVKATLGHVRRTSFVAENARTDSLFFLCMTTSNGARHGLEG